MSNYWNRLIAKNSEAAPAIQPRLPARFESLAPAPAEPPAEDVALPSRFAPAPQPSASGRRMETIRPAAPAPDAAPMPDLPPEAAPPRRSIRFNTVAAAPAPLRPISPASAQGDDESGRNESPVLPPAPGTEQPPSEDTPPRPLQAHTGNLPAPPAIRPVTSPLPLPVEPAQRIAPAAPLPAAERAAIAPQEPPALQSAPARIEPNIAPAPRPRPAEAAPTINVSIGRIEVKAAQSQPPAQPPPARTRFQPGLSLADYLKQRNGEKQ